MAAALIAVVTLGVVLKFAGRGVTASVAATTLEPPTVAVFTFFDDAIATLLGRDQRHLDIIEQTGAVGRLGVHATTNVANRAGRELVDTVAADTGVHDKLTIGIATTGRDGAALL